MNALNVLGVNTGKKVVVETLVHRLAVILGVNHIAVQNDERLCIGIDGVHTTNGHVRADGRSSVAQNGTNITSQQTLYILIDRKTAALVNIYLLLGNDGRPIGEGAVKVGSYQIGICLTVLYSHLQGIIAFGIDINGIREDRDGQFIAAILFGKGGVTLQAQGLNADTAHGVTRSIVNDNTRHHLHLVCLFFLRSGSLLDNDGLFFFGLILRIDIRHTETGKRREA